MYATVSIIFILGGSLIRALKELYPDYDWKGWKFKKVSQNYWDSEENRKDFLDSMAKQFGIDPTTEKGLDGWYNIRVITTL